MKKYEKVLVIPNNKSYHYGASNYIHIENNGNEAWQQEVIKDAAFVERWMAEEDNTILQIIPYVIIFSPDGKLFAYQRKSGGEKRLEGKFSVGIGGHINPVDSTSKQITWDVVLNAALREIDEEVYISPLYAKDNIKMLGVIYTPDSPDESATKVIPTVGEVHLGVLYGIKLEAPLLTVREDENMLNTRWVGEPPDITKYEYWSQLVLQNIDTLRLYI